MQISKYFASLSVDVDTRSIRKVDKFLKDIEKKLKSFKGFGKNGLSFGISNFTVDQRKLNLVLGNSLDRASGQVRFEVSRFVVNERNLQAALTRASRRVNITGQTSVGRPAPLSGSEFDRRRALLGQEAALRQQRQLELAQLRGVRSPGRIAGGAATGGGLIARGASGILAPALALGFGGYGLGALNQRNQQVVSAQLQSSAVVQQAGGTAEQGQASFQYLRNEGQRIGFNYLDASQDYNKLISGLTGSGIGLGESQKVFSGFAELARVNKLDKTTQNRLFRALSQVAGKGKLQAEELTGQISEALPGGTALFARAYQAQLAAKGQGGGLTGQAAITKLLADMKKGLVTSDILTYAGRTASADAAPSLPAAQTASQAEQQRYQNQITDLAVVASNSGVEEGFARIFRTLNAGLSESNGLVRTLSEQFNEATKFADDLLLFPQSFIRALEGKDSLVADFLGVDKTAQLIKDWKEIRDLWNQITAIQPSDLFGNFLPTIEATSRELAAILNTIANLKNIVSGNLPTELSNRSDTEKANLFGLEYTSPVALASDFFNNSLVSLGRNRDRNTALNDENNAFYQNPTDYDDNLKNMLEDLANQQKSQPLTTSVSLTISVDPITLANMDVAAQAEDLGNRLVTMFEQVNVNFPVGE